MAGRKRPRSLFVDPDFSPDISSLTTKRRRVPQNMRNITWRRPKEICKKPKFIVDGATRFDLDQGKLGNCWFIAAAALVATKEDLFECCVPPDQGFGHNYNGKFRFYFWLEGERVKIVIDDYLPTYENKLIYAHNREEPNEFWAALLEKAYAKFCSSYEKLEGGHLEDALENLTGGQTYVISIHNKRKIPYNLDEILLECWSLNSFIGCCIWEAEDEREFEQDNGLIMGHAYSITSLKKMKYRGSYIFLCRLRNPWGRGEWTGKWSDKSKEIRYLSRKERKELGIVIENDGEFWISLDDVKRNFDEIQICLFDSEESDDDSEESDDDSDESDDDSSD